MVKKYLLPAIAFLGGILGIWLRQWQLNTAFELDTGLPIQGSPATLTIGLLTVLVAVFLLVFSIMNKRGSEKPLSYNQGFHCRSAVYLFLVWASALLTLVAAVFYFHGSRSNQGLDILQLLLAIFAAGAGLCLVAIGLGNHQSKNMNHGSLPLLMPAFCCCIWLMVAYQGWARDPNVSDYVFALFAIMSSMMAHYFIASYSFGKPRFAPVCVASMLAVYFSLISLSGGVLFAERCLYLAQICYLTPTVFVLCRSHGQGVSATDLPEANSDHPLKEDIL